VREFLSRHGISFQEHRLWEEPAAIDEVVALTGALQAPVVRVGNRFVLGYDPPRMRALLWETGQWPQGPQNATHGPPQDG
jgi:glutaredoxin